MTAQPLAIGVDLGGTNIRVAMVDAAGRIQGAVRHRVGEDRGPDAVTNAVVRAIEQVEREAAVSRSEALAVGVGIAGQLRGESGVVALAPNLAWREIAFGPMLATRLGRRVILANDLDAIALGEVRYGAARGHRNVLVVFTGTGVGGGLVIGGELYRGAGGVATEIGHVKVRGNGAECGCGSRGCLEAYLGGANLSRRLREEARLGWEALRGACGGQLEALHPGMVEGLVLAADERAIALWRELADHFGTVLANAVTLLNPSALVLGGTVMAGCPTLRTWSEEVLRDRALAVSVENLTVLSARLGDDAGVIGAASLAMQPG